MSGSGMAVAGGEGVSRLRYRLYGLIFVLIAALLMGLLVAIYNKAFTPYVAVTLNSDRAGLQLLETSDVKIRGLIVGEVRAIRATPGGAAIDLAIQPDKAPLIPRDVSARATSASVLSGLAMAAILPNPQPDARGRPGNARRGKDCPTSPRPERGHKCLPTRGFRVYG